MCLCCLLFVVNVGVVLLDAVEGFAEEEKDNRGRAKGRKKGSLLSKRYNEILLVCLVKKAFNKENETKTYYPS